MSKKQTKTAVRAKLPFEWGLAVLCLIFIASAIITTWRIQWDYQTGFALVTGIAFIGFLISVKNRAAFKQTGTSWLFILLTAQTLLYLIGLFYGRYPKFALREFFTNCGGLFAFSMALTAFYRGGRPAVEIALRRLAICVALVCLVSIELATTRYTAGFLARVATFFGAQASSDLGAFETNTRMTSLFGNPNVFAPVAVFGIFLALASRGKMGDRSRRSVIYVGCAALSAAAFILCFSLGTILTYLAALFVITLIAEKNTRLQTLGVNLYALVSGMVGAVFVFALRVRGILPLIAVLVISLAAGFAYAYLRPVKVLSRGTRPAKLISLSAAAVCVVYVVLALLIQGPYTLDKGEGFRRAVSLKAGDYTLSADAELNVDVRSMSYTQAALKETTPLAAGVLKAGEKLAFTVPEEAAAVFVAVSAPEAATVTTIDISGAAGSETLPLRYQLVPEFIVNRLQGIWVNDNAIQRIIFYRDGLRMGIKSPVFGLGGGAFEGEVFGTADYFYLTRHSHNEFIERFIDGGIIGLILFAAVPVILCILLVRARRVGGQNPLFPLLAGCVTMIFVHALLEVDFIMPAYRVISSVILALAAYELKDKAPIKDAYRKIPIIASSVLVAAAVLLAAGRIRAVNLAVNAPTMKTLKSAAVLDPCNATDYTLSYILASVNTDNPVIHAQAAKYLTAFDRRTPNPDEAYLLAQYYLTKPEPDAEKGALAAETSIRGKRVDLQSWDNVFRLYASVSDAHAGDRAFSDRLRTSVFDLAAYLQELNETLPKQIQPPLTAYTYLRAASSQASPDDIIDSRLPCDLNADGVSDILDVTAPAGTTGWRLHVLLGNPSGYTLRVYHNDPTAACTVTLGGAGLPLVYDENSGCFIASIPGGYTDSVELAVNIADGGSGAYFTVSANG